MLFVVVDVGAKLEEGIIFNMRLMLRLYSRLFKALIRIRNIMFFGEISPVYLKIRLLSSRDIRPFIFRSRRVSGLVCLSNWWSLLQFKSNRFLFSCKMAINRQDGILVDSTHDCNYPVFILSYIYIHVYCRKNKLWTFNYSVHCTRCISINWSLKNHFSEQVNPLFSGSLQQVFQHDRRDRCSRFGLRGGLFS